MAISSAPANLHAQRRYDLIAALLQEALDSLGDRRCVRCQHRNSSGPERLQRVGERSRAGRDGHTGQDLEPSAELQTALASTPVARGGEPHDQVVRRGASDLLDRWLERGADVVQDVLLRLVEAQVALADRETAGVDGEPRAEPLRATPVRRSCWWPAPARRSWPDTPERLPYASPSLVGLLVVGAWRMRALVAAP